MKSFEGKVICTFFVTAMAMAPAAPVSAGTDTGSQSVFSHPISLLVVLAILALAPFILVMATSFVKMAAVLSIVRSALGTQQIPPNQVVTGLAIVLTIYVMTPVVEDVNGALNETLGAGWLSAVFKDTGSISSALKAGAPPVKRFLKQHTHQAELKMFSQMTPHKNTQNLEETFTTLLPAFVLSELKEAFQIGFLIFLPFVVIDMVVANILQALGMVMLSPTTISLPFKLLLFVLADGWRLIAQGLLAGYMR